MAVGVVGRPLASRGAPLARWAGDKRQALVPPAAGCGMSRPRQAAVGSRLRPLFCCPHRETAMTFPAETPVPPYYAVIFTSTRTPGDEGYGAMADHMEQLAATMPGFLGVSRCAMPAAPARPASRWPTGPRWRPSRAGRPMASTSWRSGWGASAGTRTTACGCARSSANTVSACRRRGRSCRRGRRGPLRRGAGRVPCLNLCAPCRAAAASCCGAASKGFARGCMQLRADGHALGPAGAGRPFPVPVSKACAEAQLMHHFCAFVLRLQ